MSKHSKAYEEALGKVDREREYEPAEAIALVKDLARANFDESIELHIRTGLNVRHAEEQLRGSIALPHGLGKDVTIIGLQRMVEIALEAADHLAEEGIEAEVIDPRTIVPLDLDTIIKSVKKTHRVVIIEEAYQAASVGSFIAEQIQRVCFDELDAPVMRVCNEFVPMPYAENLEHRVLPEVERIIPVIKQVLYMD